MAEERDFLLGDEDPSGDDLGDLQGELDADLDPDAAEATSDDAEDEFGAQALLTFADRQKQAQEASDAEIEGLIESVTRPENDPVDSAPKSDLERAADAFGAMSPKQQQDWMAEYRAEFEKGQAAQRAGRPGFDDAGEPVVVDEPEPQIAPVELDAVAFDALVRAGTSGGVNAADIPPGWTLSSWTRYVDAQLGIGEEQAG